MSRTEKLVISLIPKERIEEQHNAFDFVPISSEKSFSKSKFKKTRFYKYVMSQDDNFTIKEATDDFAKISRKDKTKNTIQKYIDEAYKKYSGQDAKVITYLWT